MSLAAEEYLFWGVIWVFFVKNICVISNIGEDFLSCSVSGAIRYPNLTRVDVSGQRRLFFLNPFSFFYYIKSNKLTGDVDGGELALLRSRLTPFNRYIKIIATNGFSHMLILLSATLASFKLGFVYGFQLLLVGHFLCLVVALVVLLKLDSDSLPKNYKIKKAANLFFIPANVTTFKLSIFENITTTLPVYNVAYMSVNDDLVEDYGRHVILTRIENDMLCFAEESSEFIALNSLREKFKL